MVALLWGVVLEPILAFFALHERTIGTPTRT